MLAALAETGAPPALVGLSLSFQRRAKDFLALSIALRQRGYAGHITAGGHFGTFACREILRDFPEVDSICRHEAEETLVSLAKALGSGGELAQIPGLAYQDAQGDIRLSGLPALPDLHKLPPPDRRGAPSECLAIAWLRWEPVAVVMPIALSVASPPGTSRRNPANGSGCGPWKTWPMRWRSLYHRRRIEIFIFHDDNFFLPNRTHTLKRIHSLADALDERGVRNFTTIVKARPNDLDPEVMSAMRERLGLIRIYVGIESNSEQGLLTLGRRVSIAQNEAALELVERFGIFACFNTLIFDP